MLKRLLEVVVQMDHGRHAVISAQATIGVEDFVRSGGQRDLPSDKFFELVIYALAQRFILERRNDGFEDGTEEFITLSFCIG